MKKEARKIHDIAKGFPLPRVVLSFISKKIKVSRHGGDFYRIPLGKTVEAKLASSPWRQLEDFNEKHELLEMRNKGVRYVARVYHVDLR